MIIILQSIMESMIYQKYVTSVTVTITQSYNLIKINFLKNLVITLKEVSIMILSLA